MSGLDKDLLVRTVIESHKKRLEGEGARDKLKALPECRWEGYDDCCLTLLSWKIDDYKENHNTPAPNDVMSEWEKESCSSCQDGLPLMKMMHKAFKEKYDLEQEVEDMVLGYIETEEVE